MDVTGRHRTTVTRWRQQNRFPPEIKRLADLEFHGEIGLIHDRWAGWRLDRMTGELVAPNGDTFLPAELTAISLRYQELQALRQFRNNVRGTERDPTRPIRAIILRALRKLLGRPRRS